MIVARLMDTIPNEEIYNNISNYIHEIPLESNNGLVAWQPVLGKVFPYDYQ